MRQPSVASIRQAGPRRQFIAAALAALALCGAGRAQAQLTWGVNGAGGAGRWDATAANWYNGANNVPWDGGAAVFAGAPGAVSAESFLPVQAMIFNTAGYSINNGFFLAPGDLTVTANADATINSTSTSNTSGATFIKNGSATLIYAGVNFFGKVWIDSGEYVATTSSAAFFSTFTLADAAGVTLTLGGASSSLNGLNGGGAAGGVVRPAGTQTGVVNVTNFGSGSFGGVLQDNGSARLGFQQFSGSTQTLTGVNTYTGPTSVTFGTMTLAGGGSTLKTSAMTVASGSSLVLDNAAAPLGDRVADALAISVAGGQVSLIGNASTPVTETLGTLQFSGGAAVNATQPGTAAARLNFAGIARTAGATLNVTGNGGVILGGVANGANGIIGASVTAGNEWAVVGPDGTVQALSNYNPNPATAGAADHVKITAAGTALAPATAPTWNTLNLQNAGTSPQTLNLGAGSVLTLAGGGVLGSGAGAVSIANGSLAAGGELVVVNRNAMQISSNIVETAAGTALTKSGPGVLTLSGANTYSGPTQIAQGTLAVSSDSNLGAGANISFGGGTLQANASFTTAKSLSRTTSSVSVINTNGFNVTIGGTNDALQQTGAGVLTLTNGATGSTYTSSTGTLVLANATSGSSTLMGGTLRAAGTLNAFSLNTSGTLDVGGAGAQTLAIGNFSTSGGGSGAILTIRFTLGATAQDQLSIQAGNAFGLSSNSLLFTIDQLGDLQTGTYTLVNLPNGAFGYQATQFGLSPEATAAGYRGSFAVGTNAVTLSLTSVPEPSVCALICGAAALLGGSLWRRRGRADG